MKKSRGYIQVYTGTGKGKTTAALGLTIRALGAGWRVFWGQFIKRGNFSELKALKRFDPQVKIYQFGRGRFIKGHPTPEDIACAQEGWRLCKEALFSGNFDLLVFDELNLALYFKLLVLEEVLEVLNQKPLPPEVVITGRYAPNRLLDIADLVTEMRQVKHYYQKGVEARTGIEK